MGWNDYLVWWNSHADCEENSICIYEGCIYAKKLGKRIWANSVDPHHRPQITAYSVVFDQGLHVLPLIQQIIHTSTGSKTDKLQDTYGKE